MKFSSLNEKASAYLNNTYVLVDGEILYIRDNCIFNADGDSTKLTEKKARTWNFKSPKLGYAFYSNQRGYVYLRRFPHRAYKTGVYSRNTSPDGFFGKSVTSVIQSLQDIQDNHYVSWEEASSSKSPKAFSRCYAASKAGIEYCGNSVGSFEKDCIIFDTNRRLDFHSENLRSICSNLEFTFKEYTYVDPFKEDV